MPVVAHNSHPSLARVAREGFDVITGDQAQVQDIRELHIGFLNMMPDAAFLATERQFFRLTASSTNIVQIYIHPIRCGGITRSEEISNHIDEYYENFEKIKAAGLDAIIVTGANPQFADLTQEAYWKYATEIFEWAENNVCSVFFSCLASHAVLQAQHELTRTTLEEKLWGIYSHKVVDKHHPLVSNINTRFDMPHSRGNDLSEQQLKVKQLKILVKSDEAGVAISTSADGFRQIYCQGHPEYDTASILKEYQREITRFENQERKDYPQLPHGYVGAETQEILMVFQEEILAEKAKAADFPNEIVLQYLDNTWRDTAKSIFSNWLGLVYRITHVDRTIQFMDGIDPQDPIAKWYSNNN